MRFRRRPEVVTAAKQPVVVANDWTTLRVPDLGTWHPTRSVSVVIPACRPRHLPHVLAALAAQSYPSYLLEVIVVDDCSDAPIVLPEVRPTNTKLVTTSEGWGPGAARITGVDQSDGDVLHWLDADVVPSRGHVEAQQRWHHVVDYAAVLGELLFVDDEALDGVKPEKLRDAVGAGNPLDALGATTARPNEWVSRIYAETNRLATAGPRAMRVHVTGSSSVTRDLYRASGGFPRGQRFGEDTVLGYRLREAGAIFVPEAEAPATHLGRSHVQRVRETVNRYAKPFITDQVPEFRGHRLRLHRSYAVPYVEALLPVSGATFEDVSALVTAQLDSSVPDLVVTLIAPWSGLSDDRRPVLDEADADLHLVRAAYGSEPRVRLVDAPSPLSDATFRLQLPGVHQFPTGDILEKLLYRMETEHLGLVRIDAAEGRVRVERTAAVARALRIVGEPLGELVYQASDLENVESAFATTESAPQPRPVRGLVPWRTQDS